MVAQGTTFQISAAYCTIVRSLENGPELATLRTTARGVAMSGSMAQSKIGRRSYSPFGSL
jgi:hypothetical protein